MQVRTGISTQSYGNFGLGMQLRADAHRLGHAEMPDKYAKDARRRAAADDDET
jgi:hypothetical protein